MTSPLRRALVAVFSVALAGLFGLDIAYADERGPVTTSASTATDDATAARVIVKYKTLGTLMRTMRSRRLAGSNESGPQFAATLGQRHGMTLRDGSIIEGRTQVVHGASGQTSAALAATLSADPEVEYAVPDQRRHVFAVPNDPLYAGGAGVSPTAGQWYLQAPNSTIPSAIDAVDAWAATTGQASVVIADLDTGVRFDHPDLANKLLPGRNFVTATGSGTTGWSADATDPGDYTTTTNQCGDGAAPHSSHWHGTQTSGIIGAQTNNGVGMASVGYNVMVLPVRVIGTCGGYDSDILAGMLWAGGVSANPVVNPTPAKVLNMSFGGSGTCSQAYQDVISQLNAAGVSIVVSAGNDEGLAVGSPANCTGVVAVGGLRQAGTKVGYSNVGPQIAISAPAGNCVNTTGTCLYPILTTTNAGATTATTSTYTDGTNLSLGTSFSAPLVTGTIGLMLSANPKLTPTQVTAMLKSSATAFPTSSSSATATCHAPNATAQDECICTTSTCGAGMLNAAAAVAAASGSPTASALSAVITPSATTVIAGASISLGSSTSTASTGSTIQSWQWRIVSGSSFASLANATSASAALTGIAAGSVVVQLTVTDSSGATATTQTTVTVNAPAAPAAVIVASANVVAGGATVTLDGSESSAASGLSITAYAWSIASGGSFASFTSVTNTSTATLYTAAAGGGSTTITLTVTDSLNRQSSTTTTITVSPTSPVATIDSPATTLTTGGSLTLTGSNSIAPTGRSIAAYAWSITSGTGVASITSASSTGPTVVVAASAAGSFTVRLTVTDSLGVQGSSTQVYSVNAAAATTTASASPSSGGGGAIEWSGLLFLALAVVTARGFRAAC